MTSSNTTPSLATPTEPIVQHSVRQERRWFGGWTAAPGVGGRHSRSSSVTPPPSHAPIPQGLERIQPPIIIQPLSPNRAPSSPDNNPPIQVIAEGPAKEMEDIFDGASTIGDDLSVVDAPLFSPSPPLGVTAPVIYVPERGRSPSRSPRQPSHLPQPRAVAGSPAAPIVLIPPTTAADASQPPPMTIYIHPQANGQPIAVQYLPAPGQVQVPTVVPNAARHRSRSSSLSHSRSPIRVYRQPPPPVIIQTGSRSPSLSRSRSRSPRRYHSRSPSQPPVPPTMLSERRRSRSRSPSPVRVSLQDGVRNTRHSTPEPPVHQQPGVFAPHPGTPLAASQYLDPPYPSIGRRSSTGNIRRKPAQPPVVVESPFMTPPPPLPALGYTAASQWGCHGPAPIPFLKEMLCPYYVHSDIPNLVNTRNPTYCFSDASIAFIVAGNEYRVHRSLFETQSSFFKTALSPWRSVSPDKMLLTVPLNGVTPQEFETLLQLFYPRLGGGKTKILNEEARLKEARTIVKLANRWEFHSILKNFMDEYAEVANPINRILIAKEQIAKPSIAPADPWATPPFIPYTPYVSAAQPWGLPSPSKKEEEKVDWASYLLDAYKELCLQGAAITMTEARSLGLETAMKIWETQDYIRTSHPPTFFRAPTYPPSAPGSPLSRALDRDFSHIDPRTMAAIETYIQQKFGLNV